MCLCLSSLEPRNRILLNAGSTSVLVLGAVSRRIGIAKPLIVVIPVPLAAPKPIIFPVMVAEPSSR